jgi:hypothetical protein
MTESPNGLRQRLVSLRPCRALDQYGGKWEHARAGLFENCTNGNHKSVITLHKTNVNIFVGILSAVVK